MSAHDDPLAFLLAQSAVIQLHARYTDAVWRKDLDAVADCFAPDAQWRIGGRIMAGRDAIVAQMERVFPQFRRILMTMRNPFVALAPDGAEARTYVTENNVRADGTPVMAIGIYFDRVVMSGGQWRFAWRLFQTGYFGPPDLSGTLFEGNPDFGPPPAMPPRDAATIDFTGMHTRAGAPEAPPPTRSDNG